MSKRQTEFDFSARGSRLALLNRVQLPKVPGGSPGTMLSVLRCIESHVRDNARCRVGVALLASETGYSKATVKRATAGLRGLLVLDVVTTGRTAIYQIIWSNLADFDSAVVKESFATESTRIEDSQIRPVPKPVSPQRAHHEPAEGSL